MNSAFGMRSLASPEVIIQVLFTSEQPKRNKHFCRVVISKDLVLVVLSAIRLLPAQVDIVLATSFN